MPACVMPTRDGYGDMAVDPNTEIVAGTDCNDDPAQKGELQYPGRPYYPDCDGDGFFRVDPDGAYDACELPTLGDLCGAEWVEVSLDDIVIVNALPASPDLYDCDDTAAKDFPWACRSRWKRDRRGL